MKALKIGLLLTIALMSGGCALGGLIQADQLEGTWVSDSHYSYSSNSYFVYYDFNCITVDLNGNQTGKYRIRGYKDTFWWDNNYQQFEDGTYRTDFINSTIHLYPNSGGTRVLTYSLSDYYLTFYDYDWWSSSRINLRKL